MGSVKKIIFLFVCCFIANESISQSKSDELRVIDSLTQLLKKLDNGYKNPGEDIKVLFNYAKKYKDKKIEADSYFVLGKYQALVKHQLDSATQSFTRSLTMYDSLKNVDGVIACNLQLGVIRFSINDYNEAIYYFKKNINNKKYTKSNATAIYLTAISYSELNKFDTAIYYFDKAIKEYKKYKNTTGVKMSEMFIGKMFNNKKEYKKAAEHLNNIIKRPINREDSFSFSPGFAFLSTSYLNLKDYKNAIKTAHIVYNFIKNDNGSVQYYRESLKTLHQAYKEIGNKEKAYEYLIELSRLNDSILNQDVIKGVSKAKSQYEFQLKLNETQLAQVKKDLVVKQELSFQKTLRNSFLIGFAFVGVFALVIYSQRNKIRKSKQRSDELLLNILPFDVAEELKEKGHADAKQFEQVTVIFTDFKGFTEISQELSPQELVTLINEHFSEFDKIMQRNGVEKIKTIGDAYMAVGGLPIPNSTHPIDVIAAAIEIQQYLLNINKIKKAKNEKYFEARIGIHTGSVVAGIVGLKKFSYDVWGDTVNTASRMENNCEVGKINISETTYEFVKDKYTFEYRGKLEAKGKGLIDMYYVNT